MNDSLKHIIFTETDCISEQTMFDYIDKKLSAKENHSVEKHLLHCELCSDAMEGLELVKNRSLISAVNQNIRERIAAPVIKKETKTILFYYKLAASIAAAIVLLLGGVFFFDQINKKNDMVSVAEVKPQSSPSQPIINDKTVLDSVPSSSPPPPPVTGKAADLETIAGTRLKEASKLKEEPELISAEKTVSQKHFKTPDLAFGTKETISPVASDAPVQQETANETASNSKLADDLAVTPKAELRDRERTVKFDDAKKSEEGAGSVANMQSVTSSVPASPAKAAAKPAAEEKIAAYAVTEQSAKKSKSNMAYRSESAGKDKSKAQHENLKMEPSVESKGADKDAKETFAMDEVRRADNTNVSSANDTRNLEGAASTQQIQMPQFPGGQDSLLKFISKNFNYPVETKNKKSGERIIHVQLTIDEKGNVKKSKIIKGINSELDKEALRVVSLMPKWKPAFADGKPVEQKVNVPIKLTN